MATSRENPRGFTLIEMMVVVAIIGILCLVAFDSMRRSRPRATFNSISAELQSLVHSARQQALASGTNVIVLVFPKYANGDSRGRIIVVQDARTADESLLVSTAALNLISYDPATLASPGTTAATRGQVITHLDLPRGILIGPTDGSGLASLPYPYSSITTNVDCSFCNTGSTRGAIVFDSRGRTSFFTADATTITASGQSGGASLTIYAPELGGQTRNSTSTLVITRPQGMLRTVQND